MEPAVLFVVIMMICELFEAWWQRADTIEGLLANGYRFYRQSIFVFFLMHPSFYFVLFVILATGIFNGWMMTVLVLKVTDLFLKITMMQKLFCAYGSRRCDWTVFTRTDESMAFADRCESISYFAYVRAGMMQFVFLSLISL